MKANNKTISAASLRAKVDRDLFLITQDVKIEDFKRNVKIISLGEKPFALNHKNKGREEVLIIGQ